MQKNSGAPPQTPMGELPALPHTPLLGRKGTPLPHPPPLPLYFFFLGRTLSYYMYVRQSFIEREAQIKCLFFPSPSKVCIALVQVYSITILNTQGTQHMQPTCICIGSHIYWTIVHILTSLAIQISPFIIHSAKLFKCAFFVSAHYG